MGMYSHIQQTFQAEYHSRSSIYRARLSKWRKEGAIVRAERPTNLARARTLGYKAKQGYCIVRVRVGRGMRKRPHPWGGRKPGKNYAYVQPGKSLQHISEERAGRRYSNLEVLNSYFVGSDGQYKYFEIILVDAEVFPGTLSPKRAFRGLTSSARRGRGLYSKGNGSEKSR